VRNLVQYASALSAFGCDLNFISKEANLEIVTAPAEGQEILDKALQDIDKMEDTRNAQDAHGSIMLADYIDGEPNCIPNKIRENTLNALKIKRGYRFIEQRMNIDRGLRSWHGSEVPGECTSFGELCTHRGIVEVEGKVGRRSRRGPQLFHRKTPRGIAKENLVTPNIQALYAAIPREAYAPTVALKINGETFNLDDDMVEFVKTAIIKANLKKMEAKV
jgi:hypothetical protein